MGRQQRAPPTSASNDNKRSTERECGDSPGEMTWRLLIDGLLMQQGIHYNASLAPVVRTTTLRALLSRMTKVHKLLTTLGFKRSKIDYGLYIQRVQSDAAGAIFVRVMIWVDDIFIRAPCLGPPPLKLELAEPTAEST